MPLLLKSLDCFFFKESSLPLLLRVLNASSSKSVHCQMGQLDAFYRLWPSKPRPVHFQFTSDLRPVTSTPRPLTSGHGKGENGKDKLLFTDIHRLKTSYQKKEISLLTAEETIAHISLNRKPSAAWSRDRKNK